MSKRSEVTNFIADAIDKILPDGFNKKQILDFLNQKTDKEFEEYLINLKLLNILNQKKITSLKKLKLSIQFQQ